jgi:hypothetical protein
MSSCNSATFSQANEGPRSTYAAIAAPCAKSRSLISIFPLSVNWRRRSFRPAMRSKRVRWR